MSTAEDRPSRPLAQTPEHEILAKLEDLRIRLNASYVEKYDHFIRHSDMHRACGYALKCKGLFFMVDFLELRELIGQAEFLIKEFENGGYGKDD